MFFLCFSRDLAGFIVVCMHTSHTHSHIASLICIGFLSSDGEVLYEYRLSVSTSVMFIVRLIIQIRLESTVVFNVVR